MSGAQPWRVGLDVLVQHLPLGVFITSATGAVLYVSDRCAEMIGAERDPSGGWAWVDRIHPDDRDRVMAAWAESLGGDSLDVNYRVRVRRPTRALGPRARRPRGRARTEVQAIIGTVEDITDLRELHQKWGDRQLMLDAVLSNSSDLVVVVDPAGTLSFVSQAADRILGHDPQYWLGRDVFELLHPDDIGRAAEALAGSVGTGPGVKAPMELRVLHADGTWREVEIIANNLIDVEHVGGLVITARDISDRLRAQASCGTGPRPVRAGLRPCADRHGPGGQRRPPGPRQRGPRGTWSARTVQDLTGREPLRARPPRRPPGGDRACARGAAPRRPGPDRAALRPSRRAHRVGPHHLHGDPQRGRHPPAHDRPHRGRDRPAHAARPARAGRRPRPADRPAQPRGLRQPVRRDRRDLRRTRRAADHRPRRVQGGERRARSRCRRRAARADRAAAGRQRAGIRPGGAARR